MATPSIDLVRVKLMDQDPTSLGDMDDAQISTINDALIDLRTNGQWTQLSKDERAQATRLAQNIRTHIARTVAVNQGRGQPKRAFEGVRTPVPQTQIGTTANIAKYGKRAGLASVNQLVQRATDGYTGDGQYDSIPQPVDGKPNGRANTQAGSYAPADPRKRCSSAHREDGFQGQGAYWGNRLGGMVPYIGRFVAPLASKAEDWAIGKAIDYAKDYVGRGDYMEDAMHEGIRPSQGDYLQGPANWRGRGDYTEEAMDEDRQAHYRAQPLSNQQQPTINVNTGGGVLRTNQIVDPGKPFSRRPPTIVSNGKGGMIWRHREFIQDLTPTASTQSDGFQTQAVIALNPGLKQAFPLLSQFAKFFAEYKFNQLIVRQRSVVSSGNNNAAGTSMIAIVYNANALPFTDKRSMDNSAHTVSGTVQDTLVAGVEEDEAQKALGGFLFVRTGAVNGNLSTYDQGILQVATANATPGLTYGELWIDYEVELDKMRDVGGVTCEIGDGYAVDLSTSKGDFENQFCGITPLATSGPTGLVSQFPLSEWTEKDGTQFNSIPAGGVRKFRYGQLSPSIKVAVNAATLQNVILEHIPQPLSLSNFTFARVNVIIRTTPNARYLFSAKHQVVVTAGTSAITIPVATSSFGGIALTATNGARWLNPSCELYVDSVQSGSTTDGTFLANATGYVSTLGSCLLVANPIGGETKVSLDFYSNSFNLGYQGLGFVNWRTLSFAHSLVRIE